MILNITIPIAWYMMSMETFISGAFLSNSFKVESKSDYRAGQEMAPNPYSALGPELSMGHISFTFFIC